MILQLIRKLNIIEDSAVFCSTKSVDKLKRNGFNRAYDNWNGKYKKPYMFFTSRFYSALDIEFDEKPDIVFVTEPYFAEYTMIDLVRMKYKQSGDSEVEFPLYTIL